MTMLHHLVSSIIRSRCSSYLILVIAAKGKFINAMNLAGFSIWHVAGDYNDILIDSLHSSMDIVSEGCS